MQFRLLLLSCLALLLSNAAAFSQPLDSLTQAYSPESCSSCAEWNESQEPFLIHGDTYYVGTRGLSAILITSPDGHILIDAALPNSAPLILENVRKLGFHPSDIRLILNSHAHFDHAGGIAAIQRETGARVAASPASAAVIESGRSDENDPQYGLLVDYPPVPDVQRFTPGDTLRAGNLKVASHATGGHTPGGTTWSWQSCEESGCLEFVYADSQTPVSADDFLFSDTARYPDALTDFERGHAVLENLQCDIMVTTHPGATALWERYAEGRDALIDPDACKSYAAAARRMLEDRLERESANRQNEK